MVRKDTEELFSFLKQSPTAFHAVESIRGTLDSEGFVELLEGECWTVSPGGKYYVVRNQSSIIAFKVGTNLERYAFQVVASHSDSPTFKVKENAQISVNGKYTVLNTEGYGGMICSSWLDRPLSLAGRAVVKENDSFYAKLVCFDRDLVLIPNVAIHMNRAANDGYAYNKQKDMLPLFGGEVYDEAKLCSLVAEELGTAPGNIFGMDLYLYNRMEPCVWGASGEFLSAPRLDDLECAYASLQGFLRGGHEEAVQVYACFDNEEVGSVTKQGADSTFLRDVLFRVNDALGKSREEVLRAFADSFMLSCDNAHAVHPNHPEKTDVNNCAYMNEGVVVKSHAGQKYTTDAVSAAVFREICERACVPVQYFANRSDSPGGSTLGNISMSQVSMNCIDIGLAQLAMHSSYETAGAKDVGYMIDAVKQFYSTRLRMTGRGAWKVE